MRKITVYLTFIFLFFTQFTIYAVDVPDFSFKGEEITSFSLAFEFKNIEIELDIPSEYRNYANVNKISLNQNYSQTYTAQKYSGWYDYSFTTSLASIFTDNAYRNYISNAYLREDYNLVSNYFVSKKNSLGRTKDESYLIYALGLLRLDKTRSDGESLLLDFCTRDNFDYRQVACDAYSGIMYNEARYAELADNFKYFSYPVPVYTFTASVISYFKVNNFAQASKLMDSYPRHIFFYPRLNDLKASAAYANGDYKTVAGLKQFTTDAIAFINADSYINLGDYSKAGREIKKLSKSDELYYIKAKYYLAKKLYNDAFSLLDSIKNEDYRFELLRYYTGKEFPNLKSLYLKKFKFKNVDKKDYPIYYEAMQNMQLKNYRVAAELFGKITGKELVDEASFYRGIALIYVNPEKAEADIINIMNTSNDPVQIAQARFMLAQVYFSKGGYNEALQLLDGCTAGYCRELEAEIYVKTGNIKRALNAIEGINSSKASLVKATILFNNTDYDGVRSELSNIDPPTKSSMHLLMMLAFKEDNIERAKDILNAHKDFKPILYDGINGLMLAGDYKTAYKLIGTQKDLPPYMEVAKGKLLAWSGNKAAAETVYKGLIKKKEMLYDAFSGLAYIDGEDGKELKRINALLADVKTNKDFEGRELLLVKFASTAAANRDNVLLLNIVNTFFPDYESSSYAQEMYLRRAGLFYASGRGRECLNDVEKAGGGEAGNSEEIEFMKGGCLELTELDNALKLYMKIVEVNGAFKLPAAVKIMDLSPNPNDVLGYARKVEPDSRQLYIEGVRRYVEIIRPAELSKNIKFVSRLMTDKEKPLICAGLYANAKLLNYKGRAEEAAKNYYKVYQTDPKDHFAKQSISAAAAIYKKLGMQKETEQMNAILKKIK